MRKGGGKERVEKMKDGVSGLDRPNSIISKNMSLRRLCSKPLREKRRRKGKETCPPLHPLQRESGHLVAVASKRGKKEEGGKRRRLSCVLSLHHFKALRRGQAKKRGRGGESRIGIPPDIKDLRVSSIEMRGKRKERAVLRRRTSST